MLIMKNILKNNKYILILIVLFSLNFYNLYFFLLFFALFVAIIINKNKIQFDINMLYLILLSIFLMIFMDYSSVSRTGYRVIAYSKQLIYLLGYFLGIILINEYKEQNTKCKTFVCICVCMAIGMIFHLILNYMFSYNQELITRNTYDFWTKEIWTATGQAALGVIPLGILIAYFINGNIIERIISVFFISIIMLYNLILACRTIIFIFIIVFFSSLILKQVLNRSWNNLKKIIISISIFISLFMFVYCNNFFDIKNNIKNSNLYKRFENNERILYDTRNQRRVQIINYIIKEKYFGGSLMVFYRYGYFHDLLFDAWDKASILSFIVLLLYIINSIILLLRILKSKYLCIDFKIFVFSLSLPIYLEFCVEPILHGMQWLFVDYCIIISMLNNIYYNRNKNIINLA